MRRVWWQQQDAFNDEFLDKMHMMVCGSDCHSHVARVLNLLRLGGCSCHNKVELAAYVFFCGRHIGIGGFIATWLGTAILVGISLAPNKDSC